MVWLIANRATGTRQNDRFGYERFVGVPIVIGRPHVPKVKPFLKSVLCTRSLRAALALHTRRRSDSEIRLPGYSGSLRFRTGTSDAESFRVLAHGDEIVEYRIPIECSPGTILDIGANVGVVSMILARKYPNASIFAFEPLPENFRLLRHNVAQFPNVRPIPFGLAAETGEKTYFRSADARNFGGGGFHDDGRFERITCTLPVLSVPDALEKYGVREVDIIKIDVEGGEHDILVNMPESVLRGVSVIVGELHCNRTDTLLKHLERWFTIETVEYRGIVQWFTCINRRLGRAAAGR